MGANAQTTVPTFTASQVLTADQMNQSARTGVPVFADTTARDAAFGGSGEKTLAEGQLCYLEDTNKVQYYDGSAWANLGSVTNVAAFTATTTWTVPSGVTYAIAHMTGGGGGIGSAGSPGAGGTSSVAFAGGTVSATGGGGYTQYGGTTVSNVTPPANSGAGAYRSSTSADPTGQSGKAPDGAYITAGAAVTPGASITVTVGAGGVAGTNGIAGASGYVWIEYQV
jgi:collagen type VII alpha